MFFFQFLIQAGLFFTVPLFLSVALGLSAVETGVRLLPLSVTLLARGRRRPQVLAAGVTAPGRERGARRPARRHRLADRSRSRSAPAPRSSPCRCCWPVSASAPSPPSSGAVTVSAVPDELSGEVGGLQNTAHQPRRVARDGAGRLGADRRPDSAASSRGSRTTRTSRPRSRRHGRGRARRRRSRSSPTPTSRTRLDDAGVDADEVATRSSRRTRRPASPGSGSASPCSALIAVLALFFTRAIPTVPVGHDPADASAARDGPPAD